MSKQRKSVFFRGKTCVSGEGVALEEVSEQGWYVGGFSSRLQVGAAQGGNDLALVSMHELRCTQHC
jgi:hypothetical protein